MGNILKFDTHSSKETEMIAKIIKIVGATGNEAAVLDCFISEFGIAAFFNSYKILGFTNKTNKAIENLKHIALREEG